MTFEQVTGLVALFMVPVGWLISKVLKHDTDLATQNTTILDLKGDVSEIKEDVKEILRRGWTNHGPTTPKS